MRAQHQHGRGLEHGDDRLQPPCGGALGRRSAPTAGASLPLYHPPGDRQERLKRNRAGDVVLQLKSAFKDGTTHIVMAPLEFMQRLAALVPRPRLHLIRFHGVLAPNAKLRREIIPSPVEQATEPACDHAHAQGAPARMSWARLLKRVFDIDIDHKRTMRY